MRMRDKGEEMKDEQRLIRRQRWGRKAEMNIVIVSGHGRGASALAVVFPGRSICVLFNHKLK